MGEKNITTVMIQSDRKVSNKIRLNELSKIIDSVSSDIFVFPAGWFSAGRRKAKNLYDFVESEISQVANDSVICFGVDGRVRKPWPKDQTILAIDSNGIVACARKFYATSGEKSYLNIAKDYISKEQDFPRIFNIGEKNFYLAVCYDSFGIRQKNISKIGVNGIINCIHGFYPVGQGNSGDSYFARHGLAGASNFWKCPVFGSAIFFNRKISLNWPSGVLSKKKSCEWSYKDNFLVPEKVAHLDICEGSSRIDTYKF